MAKVIGPLHSSEARGRMGGLVYNTWRGVATVKAKHAPCQPKSTLQLAVRAIAITLCRLWAACPYQADWNAYAYAHPTTDQMGNSVRATGANWYLALNTRLGLAATPPVQTPPVVAAPAAPAGFGLVGAAGGMTASWTPLAATELCELWKDGPRSAGRIASLPRARFHDRPEGTLGTYVFIGLQPGTYTIYARTMSQDDGQVSTYVSATAVVT